MASQYGQRSERSKRSNGSSTLSSVYVGNCTNISHEPKQQASSKLIGVKENHNIEDDEEVPVDIAVDSEDEKDRAENIKLVEGYQELDCFVYLN